MLREDEKDLPPEEKPIGCSGCDASAECEIWEHPCCYGCAGAIAKTFPDYGQLQARYGPGVDAPAVLREFTKRWFLARKGKAA